MNNIKINSRGFEGGGMMRRGLLGFCGGCLGVVVWKSQEDYSEVV